MQFTLYYRGTLKADGSVADKHLLRQHFHVQLKRLWDQRPLVAFRKFANILPDPQSLSVIRRVGGYAFAPLVCEEVHLIAELEMTLLTPDPPGSIITHGGDIDNRLKTLFDALRVPATQDELPSGAAPSEGEKPFFCLLSDDKLITKVTVDTAQLLEPSANPKEVILLIHVNTKQLQVLMATIGLT